jgi:hypothetical protein
MSVKSLHGQRGPVAESAECPMRSLQKLEFTLYTFISPPAKRPWVPGGELPMTLCLMTTLLVRLIRRL